MRLGGEAIVATVLMMSLGNAVSKGLGGTGALRNRPPVRQVDPRHLLRNRIG